MQGFVFISFILISLFNARFHFIIISSFWGGFIVNINKLYDFEIRACFLFLFQNEYECRYMLKLIIFGSFYHPFKDGYKNFHKTDIVSMASPGKRNQGHT